MSIPFTEFIQKPVSSKAILLEFAVGVSHSFFACVAPGIWAYRWYVKEDVEASFENGAFCYGCFKLSCEDVLTNGNANLEILSVTVDTEQYLSVSGMATLKSTEKSFLWEDGVAYVHFEGSDPPWVFSSITLGVGVFVANKAGEYNGFFYESRLKKVSPIKMKVDPLFYGLVSYGGTTVELENSDGEYDDLDVLAVFGQTVRILYGEEGADYSDFELQFTGLIDRFSVSESVATLAIRDRRKRFTRTLPVAYFDEVTYPDIDAENLNKPIPVLYGKCRNVPVACTDEAKSPAPATFHFKICDNRNPLTSISEIRVNDVPVIASSTDLVNCEFVLATADYDPGDEVTVDCVGSVGNALDVLRDMIEAYADIPYTSAFYDTVAWSAAKSVAPGIGYWTNEIVTLDAVIEEICRSLNGNPYLKADGLMTFRYHHAIQVASETITKDERFNTLDFDYPTDSFISSVAVDYYEDRKARKFLTRLVDDDEAALELTYGFIRRYPVATLLTEAADVDALAANLMLTYAVVPKTTNLQTHIAHVGLELLDDVLANLDRVTKTWFGDVIMRVYGIARDLEGGKLTLTLRETALSAVEAGELAYYGEDVYYGGDSYYGDAE